jgi:hypothetical protein
MLSRTCDNLWTSWGQQLLHVACAVLSTFVHRHAFASRCVRSSGHFNRASAFCRLVACMSATGLELTEMIIHSIKTFPPFVWTWMLIAAFERIRLQVVDNLITKYFTLYFFLSFTGTADLTAYPGRYKLSAMWCETVKERLYVLVMIKFNIFNIICFFPEIQYSAIILIVYILFTL